MMRHAISPRLAIRIRLNISPHPPTRPVERSSRTVGLCGERRQMSIRHLPRGGTRGPTRGAYARGRIEAQAIRSTAATSEGAATESVAPMPVRKAESPIRVDFRRFLLRTWEAIQTRISPSTSVERLAQDDNSVAELRATWRGGTLWPASASTQWATDLTN